MTLPVVRRLREVGEVGCRSGPDQEYGAGGVVDDEAVGRGQALGAQAAAVAVTGDDEQLRALRGEHDLLLDAAGALYTGAGATQAVSGIQEELVGGSGGEVFQAGAGVAFGVAAAEQAGEGTVRDARDLMARHMEQDDLGILRGMSESGVHYGGPGAFDDPRDDGHPLTFRLPRRSCSDQTQRRPQRRRRTGQGGGHRVQTEPGELARSHISVAWLCTIGRHSKVARERAYVRLGPMLTPSGTRDTARAVQSRPREEHQHGRQVVDQVRHFHQAITGLCQRCRPRVRTAEAIDVIRFGLHRALRKIRKDCRWDYPRSAGARAAESARLMVRWVGVRSWPGGRLRDVVTHGPAPR